MTRSALVEPAFHWCPPYAKTYGDEVIDLAKLAGFAPDPEQELALNDLFAVDPRGRSAAFEFAVVCPRQNLKTGLFKQAALGWLFITDQNLVVWSAHEFSTAQEAFRDMTILIEGCPDLDRRVKQIHRGNGDEAIELLSGQRLKFKARTKGGGRGLTGDKVVLDEAFALQSVHMGALLPTLSAVPDPQVVYGSSAGLADSLVLRGIRDRGRPGGAVSLAYVEWCDDLPGECETPGCEHAKTAVGCRLDDPRRWGRANPQMGRRITVAYIAAERQALPPNEFFRERHGRWDDPAEGVSDLDLSGWSGLENPASSAVRVDAYAVEVSIDRAWASIGVAGPVCECHPPALPCPGDLTHVEVVDRRRGTEWLLDRCLELVGRHGSAPFVVDGRGPAAYLIEELRAAGLQVTVADTNDVAVATAVFMDAVAQKTLRHGPQPELEDAINGARKRPVGDGAFAIGRRASTVDVTALQSVSLAHWAATGHVGDMSPVNNVW